MRPIPAYFLLTDHPGWTWVAAQERARHGDVHDSTIRYYLTRALLADVIEAAAGVEYTAEKIESALDRAQRWYDDNKTSWERAVDVPRGISCPEIWEARYEFTNLLAWTRGLDERLRRPAARGRRAPELGLVPALATGHPLRGEVERLHTELREYLRDRRLANYVLHSSAIPYPGAGGRVTPAGEVILPVPDPPESAVYLFDQLTWQLGRDLRSFSRELLQVVDAFMTSLIEAVERASADRHAT